MFLGKNQVLDINDKSFKDGFFELGLFLDKVYGVFLMTFLSGRVLPELGHFLAQFGFMLRLRISDARILCVDFKTTKFWWPKKEKFSYFKGD